MAEFSGAITENADEATKKMREFFRVSDDIEENYKKIVDYAKKRSNLEKGDLDDAKKARHELEAPREVTQGRPSKRQEKHKRD